jgi:hypothetical protein
LKLARFLDTTDALHVERGEPPFSMRRYSYSCKTPSCALGHWWVLMKRPLETCTMMDGTVEKDFDLTLPKIVEIFGIEGCDNAQTAKKAADYIRNYVRTRQLARRRQLRRDRKHA